MGIPELLNEYGSMYLTALLTTWWMTALCFSVGMVLAVLITVMRVSPIRPLRWLGDFYVQIFRNIAGVCLLIIIAYALPYLGLTLPWRTCVIVSTILLGSAFGSEHFLSGINAIGVGQIEAARSIGLGFWKMMRLVVIPQALRTSVLPLTNLLIGIMLTTALGSQVPMSPHELTGLVSYINTREVGGLATFAISALGYVGTSLVIGFVGNRIDQKVRIAR